MDAIVRNFPNPKTTLSEHVRAAPAPIANRPTREEAETAVRTLLAYIGENPDREGLVRTPARVVSAYEEMFRGYTECPLDVLERTFSEIATYDDHVIVKDIPFQSHCEHHIMSFFGKAHVAYRPVERVVGLSKIARLVDLFAHRLQTQERLTAQIATALDEILAPRGVAVMLEAEHTCMSRRGVQKPGTCTITTQFTGVFQKDPSEQARFVALVRER